MGKCDSLHKKVKGQLKSVTMFKQLTHRRHIAEDSLLHDIYTLLQDLQLSYNKHGSPICREEL